MICQRCGEDLPPGDPIHSCSPTRAYAVAEAAAAYVDLERQSLPRLHAWNKLVRTVDAWKAEQEETDGKV